MEDDKKTANTGQLRLSEETSCYGRSRHCSEDLFQSKVMLFLVKYFLQGKIIFVFTICLEPSYPSGQNTHMYHKSPFSSITFQKSKRPSLHSLITLLRETPRCGERSWNHGTTDESTTGCKVT